MKTLFPLKGIITVLNTPFTDSNAIDTEALKRNVDLAMKAGVAGFLVPAMASEVYKLTEKERLQMVDAVLEATNNRVPVFAGTGETDLNRSLQLLRQYRNLGCEHVLFQIPFHDEKQFVDHFMQMSDLQPGVIMLQDWDANGYGLPDSVILELFEKVEGFRCLKVETRLAGSKYSRMLELTQGTLHVSGGWAVGQMLEGLRRGVHAFMPTGMHFIYTKIFNDYTGGRITDAENLFEQLLPVLSFSNQDLDISVHFFKRLLHRQKVYNNSNVRQPILPFDAVHEEIAERLIHRVIDLEDRIRSQRSQ